MKILFLNLPYKKNVVRRWMCSYNAKNFLLPPYELLSCASYIKHKKTGEVFFIDSIAERLIFTDLINKIKTIQPDIIFSITGFEILSSDIEILKKIKELFPKVKIAVMGYYPTYFSKKFIEVSGVDFIIKNEPEIILNELCMVLDKNGSFENIKGICYRNHNKIIENDFGCRINNLDVLPEIDYSLVNINNYKEPFLPSPFITIETARGCPYNCNYCVKTYGKKYVNKSIDKIIEEIIEYKSKYKIKSFRILDDTFTLVKSDLIEFCKKMIEYKLSLTWTCLSRIDAVDEEKMYWMKKAGCRRIYFGLESGSQKILNKLRKGYSVENVFSKFKIVKKNNLETAVFVMVGIPYETDEDFLRTTTLLKKLNPDFLLICKFIAYPGTPIFEEFESETEFNLYPYKNYFLKVDFEDAVKLKEIAMFRSFYFRIGYILKTLWLFLKYPIQSIQMFYRFLYYILQKKSENKEDFI